MKKIYIVVLSLISGVAFSQENMHPSPAQSKKIVISGGTIHVGNGEILENGSIVIEHGKLKIEKVKLDNSGSVDFIDATGKQIYPGLIAPNTYVGLVEVNSTKSTGDNTEIGEFHPNIRSIIAYNTDSKVINTLRSNGVLLAQIVPEGGILPGSSSIVQLDAWNWEDAAYELDNGVHMTMPALVTPPNPRRSANPDGIDPVRVALEKIENAKHFFREAKAYLNEKSHSETNLKFEATKGLFNQSKKLFVHCDLVKEMLAAINFAKEFNFKLVIVGGTDAWMIPDLLKDNKVEVILPEPHSLPATDDDAVDQPYKTAAVLQKAGIVYSIYLGGAHGQTQQRNLPFHAGTLAAYGLTKEQALQVITLNAAKILGIDQKTGTLENGKDANVVISDGDILDMKSSTISHAFIQGRAINLDNKQKQLFERYKYKYNIK